MFKKKKRKITPEAQTDQKELKGTWGREGSKSQKETWPGANTNLLRK